VQEVAENSGLSRTPFSSLGPWEDVLAGLGMEIVEARSKRSRSSVKESFRRVFTEFEEEHGRPPKKREYDENRREDDPHSSIASTFFDSFTDLKQQLGYQKNRVDNVSREMCVDAIEQAIEELGKVPTVAEYSSYRKSVDEPLPSKPSINRHTEGYSKLLSNMGYEPNKNHWQSKDDAIEGIKAVAEVLPHDAPPKFKEYGRVYRNNDSFQSYPSNVFIAREFDGKWNNALREAGYSDEELNYDPETNNGDYDDGGHYYGPNWYEVQQTVRENDGECQVCEKQNEEHINEHGCALHVHHLIPFRLFKPTDDYEKPNSEENLVSVCYECHHRLENLCKRGEYAKQLEYLPEGGRWDKNSLNRLEHWANNHQEPEQKTTI
jgi:hypothetical protein